MQQGGEGLEVEKKQGKGGYEKRRGESYHKTEGGAQRGQNIDIGGQKRRRGEQILSVYH